MSADNPTLYGTEKDYAWDAWQNAFGAGDRLRDRQPDHTKFLAWWAEVAMQTEWKSTREMMLASWGAGVADRNEQSTAGFNVYWQKILDDQPKVIR